MACFLHALSGRARWEGAFRGTRSCPRSCLRSRRAVRRSRLRRGGPREDEDGCRGGQPRELRRRRAGQSRRWRRRSARPRARSSAAGTTSLDEADAEGFSAGDDLAGEKKTEGSGLADEPGKALCASVAGNDAKLDLGLAELCGAGGDAEGAGEGELAAAAKGEAVYEGDDGLAAVFDEREDGLAAKREALARDGVSEGELIDVCAGGEGLLARAGDEDDADA